MTLSDLQSRSCNFGRSSAPAPLWGDTNPPSSERFESILMRCNLDSERAESVLARRGLSPPTSWLPSLAVEHALCSLDRWLKILPNKVAHSSAASCLSSAPSVMGIKQLIMRSGDGVSLRGGTFVRTEALHADSKRLLLLSLIMPWGDLLHAGAQGKIVRIRGSVGDRKNWYHNIALTLKLH
eukprot:CAMPEP_0172696998 /NCGR_PEP_ID=MMETSP1074-20121228/28441_1 /TAXON_ID=2916 /ORGANISM="Ceratium fusus, Strain PA161109" /LENGTH=181 /DNA_ID=CAMNT_0013517825 /DNA_START=53 /DNA_END=597 /DNA_ORIENTATION=-